MKDIAVVGLALRFPGAADPDELWRNLVAGRDCLSRFGEEELAAAGVPTELRRDPRYVPARGVVAGADRFDAAFFGLNPRQAALTDPQHRLFLECAWEALETAGYGQRRPEERVGVFAGTGFNSYLVEVLAHSPAGLAGPEAFQAFLGNDKDFVPTRVSYLLDLKGPSVSVNSACSSSLAAVHLACQSLLGVQCDMALAGGVTVRVPQERGYLYEPDGIHSPDGRTRPFDESGQGMVDGNGAGVVLLKRYEDALADGDVIWAVIRGTAMNNDGAAKVGFTAPAVDGQAEVIAEALAVAGVEPETVTLLEAHGTGTPLGDPVEVEALRQVFAGAAHRCALGSVKGNLGHLDAAAGVAGLIKAVLALHHRTIPPTVHFQRPNPRLGLAASPFYVNAEAEPWEPRGVPRRAGVSSFGIGGTNVHAVLEEAPRAETAAAVRPGQLVLLSTRTEEALGKAADELARRLESNPEVALADVAYTLQVGRREHPHRLAVVARDPREAAQRLAGREPGAVRGRAAGEPRVAFLFPGQGAQRAGMGAELYRAEPVFRAEVDRCAELLRPHLGRDVRTFLDARAEAEMARADLSQPALFVFEHALGRLWMSWGIQPAAFLGHSLGDYVAACLSGVLSLEDALALVTARGRLVQATAPGAMLAVDLPEAELAPWFPGLLDLAAVNGPSRTVLSGAAETVAEAERELAARGVVCRRLPVAHAYHSRLLDPILEPFEAEVRRLKLEAHWVRHLRETVRFSTGLATLFREPGLALLEVGPGATLAGLALRHPDRPRDQVVLSSLPRHRDGGSETASLLTALGHLWCHGTRIDWSAFQQGQGKRRRVTLPAHPLDRQRFWVDPEPGPILTKQPDPSDWFWVPSWKRLALTPSPAGLAGARVWIMGDGLGLGTALARLLRERGCAVEEIPAAVDLPEGAPDLVVHLGGVLDLTAPADALAELDRVQDLGFYSLLSLARTLGGRGPATPVRIVAVTNQLLEVCGERAVRPERATLLGAVRIIPVEYPGLRCAAVDVELASDPARTAERLLAFLAADPRVTDGEAPIFALRGPWAWVEGLERAPLAAPEPKSIPLREGGAYLITGGVGGMGLHLAEHLAAAVPGARLLLIGRTGLAEEDERLRRVRALEEAGAEVLVRQADVADAGRMAAVLAESRARFGRLHGVIHCAGVADFAGVIHRRSREDTEAVLAPKVRGTLVLADLLQEEGLDFLVLCSSIGSVLVHQKYGQVGYAGANAFLDAFPAAAAGVKRVITINWDDWRQVGMTVESQQRWAALRAQPGFAFHVQETLLPAEGREVFQRALAHGLPRVLVSTRDLPALIRQDAAIAESYREGASRTAPRVTARPAPATAPAAPRNSLEEALTEVWREVLGIPNVGVDEGFYDLGGDSLIGLTLAGRLERRLGVAVGLAEILEHGTIARLAEHLALRRPEAPAAADPAAPVTEAADHPLSFAQQRLWFLNQLKGGDASYHIAVAARLTGPLSVAALEAGIDALLRRHAALRTSFREDGGVPRQRIAPPAPFHLAVEPYDGPALDGDSAGFQRWVSEAAREPFDLLAGPLFRARLWRLGDGRHVLLVASHHIVSDGASMSLAAEEIAEGYHAFAAGRPARLPELAVSYPQVCAQERERLASSAFAQRIERWMERYAGAPELQLPARPGAQRRTRAGKCLFFEQAPEVSRQLEEIARGEGATLFMLLLTAWEIGLWSVSGQVDLVMGTSISTREEATRHVMGLFANQLVLRTDLAGAASAREALQRARQAVLAAYEMRDVPFDLLVQRLRVPRDPGRTPLVRCNLVLQAGAGSGLALDGLQVETLPVDRGTSKLDLLLDVERRGGRLGGFLEYSTELFEPRAAEVLLGRFETALEALAADIDVTLSELRERLDAAHPLAAEVGVSRSLLRARRRAVPLASQGEAAAG